MANTVSLDNMLTSILSVSQSSRNMTYPPNIFQAQYNVVSSLLLSQLVKAYPENPLLIDVIDPFVSIAKIPVTNGKIKLPDDYRDILGAPMINVKVDNTGLCDGDPGIPVTPQTFATANLRGGCTRRPIVIVPQSEFAALTTSTYNYPTYLDPIGYFSGKREITVCPYDIAKVEVMYARNENLYVYGYITQPDDTYLFSLTNTVESEWTNPSYEYFFRALTSLYAAYTTNPTLRDWSMIIHKEGIL